MLFEEILSRIATRKILVIGDLMLDHYLWGEVSRISPEAPVPVLNVTRQTYTAGGAANVALNLASLSSKAEVIGVLGKDSHGADLIRLLTDRDIDSARCHATGDVSTIVKTRVIARTQQLVRIDHESPRGDYQAAAKAGLYDALAGAIAAADAVILSDYAKGVVSQDLVDLCVSQCRQHGKLLAIDPKPARKLNLRGAGVMTPNRGEALALANVDEAAGAEIPPLEEIARRIHDAYAPDLLVITLGAGGMAICREGKVEERLPTEAREVYDVSGAGDTVIATLTAALAAGAPTLQATQLANIAAGIVVSKMGTATVTPAEICDYALTVQPGLVR